MPGGNDTDEIRDDSERLMRSLGITEDDLAFNERGELSPGQRKRLEVVYQNWTWWRHVILIGAPTFIILSMVNGIYRQSMFSPIPDIIFILLISAILILIGVDRQRNLTKDLAVGTVNRVVGHIHRPFFRRRDADSIIIKQYRLRVQGITYQAFRFGTEYVLYYLPHARQVVGGKRLDATS